MASALLYAVLEQPSFLLSRLEGEPGHCLINPVEVDVGGLLASDVREYALEIILPFFHYNINIRSIGSRLSQVNVDVHLRTRILITRVALPSASTIHLTICQTAHVL